MHFCDQFIDVLHVVLQTDLYHAMKTAGKAEVVEITLPRPSTAGFVEDARGNSLMWTKRREEMLKVSDCLFLRCVLL